MKSAVSLTYLESPIGRSREAEKNPDSHREIFETKVVKIYEQNDERAKIRVTVTDA